MWYAFNIKYSSKPSLFMCVLMLFVIFTIVNYCKPLTSATFECWAFHCVTHNDCRFSVTGSIFMDEFVPYAILAPSPQQF